MTYLLGIDLGTSSVKVALFASDSLRLLATADREYPVNHPRPGYAEQDPQTWWQAVVQAIHAVLKGSEPDRVKAIGVDGQMHGLVCLGSDYTPVHPAIIWADARVDDEIEQLTTLQKSSAATMPGLPAAGFAATSALWLSHYQADVLQRTHVALCPKDYIRLRLTGLVGTDPSDASATWLFDIAAADWAADVVSFCGLKQEQLPRIRPSAQIFAGLSASAAKALDLEAGIPVVTGSADLPAQALGHGLIDPGTALVTVGTGGQVISPLGSLQSGLAPSVYIFQHNVPGRWYAQAAILAGGLALRWLRDVLGLAARPDAYKYLSELAADVPAGAEGLLFLPYLAGERTPHLDAAASGVFLGLRLHHRTGHLVRAVMEGVGFALRECLSLVAPHAAQVTLSGGVTQSPTWCQILADIFGQPIQIAPRDLPRACFGSAILAGVGSGIYGDVREMLRKRAEPKTSIEPHGAEAYSERYEQYQRIYPLLQDEMHLLQAQMDFRPRLV